VAAVKNKTLGFEGFPKSLHLEAYGVGDDLRGAARLEKLLGARSARRPGRITPY
jgi:hypothetical protein